MFVCVCVCVCVRAVGAGSERGQSCQNGETVDQSQRPRQLVVFGSHDGANMCPGGNPDQSSWQGGASTHIILFYYGILHYSLLHHKIVSYNILYNKLNVPT